MSHSKEVENEGEPFKDLFTSDLLNDILNLSSDHLSDAASYQQNVSCEVKNTCRDMNTHMRSNYARFIHNVGRNIYPLIIASDHEPCLSGIGSTFTLFLSDSKQEKVSPALHTDYETYKCVAHALLGVAVLVAPFLRNPGACAWRNQVSEYKKKVEVALSAMRRTRDDKTELLVEILNSVCGFLSSCLEEGSIDPGKWEQLNSANFPRIQQCMAGATQAQAGADIAALLEWKERLGPAVWREMYVVIPTVWPVAHTNPRLEMFRNLLDEDRVETHIITSEYPRNAEESRTLLGRVVGDRAIGRAVFGDQSPAARMKTVALSTPVDVVSDDAILAIHQALQDNGCKPRSYRKAAEVVREKDCPFK